MCFSALVRQDLDWLVRYYGADVAWEMFDELYRNRIEDSSIYISRALDVSVMKAQTVNARSSQAYIEQYRNTQAPVWERELFKQRKRLVDAQRSLQVKETKKARKDVEVATNKIAKLTERLTALRSDQLRSGDARIFPKYYVPVVANEGDRLCIRPMRYLCRLPGKPANYDERYKGTYNARRDNLNGFWADVYGRNHGIIVLDSFYENVPRHLYENRELALGEKEENIVLNFNPRPGEPMVIACVWAHWTGQDAPDLYSFAAVTDDPPPEILATGHTRCPISLKAGNVHEWLSPGHATKARLEEILTDHVAPYYEHRIAA